MAPDVRWCRIRPCQLPASACGHNTCDSADPPFASHPLVKSRFFRADRDPIKRILALHQANSDDVSTQRPGAASVVAILEVVSFAQVEFARDLEDRQRMGALTAVVSLGAKDKSPSGQVCDTG